MSEIYGGGKIPRSADKATRRLLEDHDRILTRGIAQGDTTVIVQGTSSQSRANSPVRYVKTGLSGDVTNIPIERAGQVLVLAFLGKPTLKSTGGNLHLSGDFTPESQDETLTLVSDGVYWREMSRGSVSHETFIPIGRWGVRPDLGVDQTVKIQEAFDECPLGAVLFIPPGTYLISDGIDHDRAISVWAYGATFDLEGNTPATGYAYKWGYAAANMQFVSVWGLTVSRDVTYTGSPSSATSAAFTSTGFKYVALSDCRAHDLTAVGFKEGHYFTGIQAAGKGIQNCDLYNLDTRECRYGLWLTNGNAATQTGGWCNGLKFFGGRHTIQPNTASDKAVTDPANFVAIYIDYPVNAASSGSIPNDHSFYSINLESTTAVNVGWGRKVYCRGETCYFYNCRYEGHNVAPTAADDYDLEVDKVSFPASGGTGRNVVFHGGFNLSLAGLKITDTAAGAIPPQGNWKIDSSKVDYTAGLYPAAGGLTDLDADVIRGTQIHCMNRGTAASPAITIYDNATAFKKRVEVQGSVHDGTNDRFGGMVMYDNSTPPVEVNRWGTQTVSPYPFFIAKGLVVNETGADADTRVEGSGDANLLYVDAGNDRVGVGTATPSAKVHIFPVSNVVSLHVETSGNSNMLVVDAANDGVGIGTASPSDAFHVVGGFLVDGTFTFVPTTVSSSPYTISGSTKGFILVDTTGGAITINLPGALSPGRAYFIKDAGNAGTNNITINPAGTDTIEGAGSKTISTNYGKLWITPDGTAGTWYIMGT